MILKFTVKNYRSYKDETTFSMEANASEYKKENVVEFDNFRVLKSAMIYGPNASGKTNLIRAIYCLRTLILSQRKAGEKLPIYDPFLFDSEERDNPLMFNIEFIGPQNHRYIYKIVLNLSNILEEELLICSKGEKVNIFKRNKFDEKLVVQTGVINSNNKTINVFSNQLILTKFGFEEPDEILTPIFLYFEKFVVINATNERHKEFLFDEMSKLLTEESDIKSMLKKLIKAADTKVIGFEVVKNSDSEKEDSFRVFGIHDFYTNNKITGSKKLSINEESKGTQSLYIFGAQILKTLEKGNILFIDELDTSLHPYITKMIVMMFQSEKLNPNHAQLIFTTHDVSLLDKDLVRKDQIWIAEKNEKGSTDLYSLQDFEDLPNDISFEKWYLAGKFGGLPQIKSIESIFDEDETV